MLLFGHNFAFEDMPFLQAVSICGSTLAFTHSKKFFPLTYAYDWKNLREKQSPIIRLGIIGGTAQSAGMFMMSQAKHPRAGLVALYSRTMEKGESCIKKYGLTNCTVYCEHDQLLADPTIEGIIVFSPISTHEQTLKNLLQAGKHCILIPPMGANAVQLKRICEYKREHHPDLLCISVYASLAHPLNHQMRELVQNGTIGTVERISVRANWPAHAFGPESIQFRYECAGGAWEDLGPHAITLACFMLQTKDTDCSKSFKVKSAIAECPSFATNVDETMNATILVGDVCVDIEVSLVKQMDTSIEIIGTKGALLQTQWYRPDMYNKLTHRKLDGTNVITEYRDHDKNSCRGPWEYTLDYLVDSFETLKPPPLMASCEEELYTMQIVDEVYRMSGLGVRCPERAES